MTTHPLKLAATLDAFIAERPASADEDVHMLAHIVDGVIEQHSAPGDLVFDPFAGFGTTLKRAVRAGRGAIGIELLPERVAQIRRDVPQAIVGEGDARELVRVLGPLVQADPVGHVDLIVSSPPYMTVNEHSADPLTAYEEDGADYGRYLDQLGLVATQCSWVLKTGGVLVWNVADMLYQDTVTTLIDDCAGVLARTFTDVHIAEIVWDIYPHDFVRDALIVCRN